VALPAELIAAYRAAHYVVFADPELVIRIGEPNTDLDALLQAAGAASAAYVTAANPRGVRRSEAENKNAFDSLQKFLNEKRYRHCAGEGRDPQGRWPAEQSFLVVGIERADAAALGRRFGQNAVVLIEEGRAPELVLLD